MLEYIEIYLNTLKYIQIILTKYWNNIENILEYIEIYWNMLEYIDIYK